VATKTVKLLQVGISFSSAFNIVEHDITKPYYITLIDANPFLVQSVRKI
jgi:hypothetical protein